MEILNRWTQKVIYSDPTAETLKDAVVKAIANRADLRGAYLRGADLRGADLRGAYLRDADLTGADLTGAYLTGAYLRGAYLRGAYLRGAYLTGAYLRDADLTGADLTGADLTRADLTGADLTGADLRGAIQGELTDEDYLKLRDEYRQRHPEVPIVPALDKQICEIVNSGQGKLNMGGWHQCETSHCRAGWAIHLAGEAGYALEAKYDSERAGGMIYRASTGRWPNFFAGTEEALKDICEQGAKEIA